MSAKYTIRRWQGTSRLSSGQPDWYDVLNPSGVAIAFNMSWRVARKIADLYNADVEWRRTANAIWSDLGPAIQRQHAEDMAALGINCAYADCGGAVSLQEEA